MRFLLALILVFSSFLSAQWGWGADDAVEEVNSGAMNYSTGWVTATGIGAISPLAQNPGMARATAVRAAKMDAMRNLLEAVMAITVTSETTVRGSAIENDVIKTSVEGMVKGARMLDLNGDGKVDYSSDIRYLSDTSIEIEMGVHMSGISSIVLPPAGYAETPAGGAPPSAATSAPTSGSTTGLIIDARGIGTRPAMSPKIVDQNGGVVYGPSSFTRDYAIKFGVAGYSKDIETAKSDPRVVGNPLIVRGIGVQGSNGTDIVVANGDAATIRQAESSGKVLSSCKVMIILD
ncbi:MAG: hypothetical protein QF923_03085 [Candidatus Marinimicrobia bacterium]|mgnify:FL=1|jgi:hypothetical protein|nr:hypothetical protein [Candidatus Neomarinimicrobiota bacterium]|tara:strand:- start:58 stop:930 length:873 start_codon:yes stop_codon:yes gene_type:complete